MSLHARPVDPRDVTVEIAAPTFRVYFWCASTDLACREFEVTGADVDAVIEWADGVQHDDETYVLGVVTHAVNSSREGPDIVLTRIKGTDPSRRDDDESDTPASAGG